MASTATFLAYAQLQVGCFSLKCDCLPHQNYSLGKTKITINLCIDVIDAKALLQFVSGVMVD